MNNVQRKHVERLARSVAFVSANAADFPQTSKGGLAAADISAILTEIETIETSRVSSMNALQQATSGKNDGRDSLRAQLRAISSTAATIALDHPEIRGIFKFKGSSVSDHMLLATARAFATAAQPLKALFIEYDMPADFLDILNASIAGFEQNNDRKTAGTGARAAANAALEDALRRGESAFRRLDTSVRNKHRDDPAKLATWESGSKLERQHRQKNGNGKQTETDSKTTGEKPSGD